jgi:hypothetical protein
VAYSDDSTSSSVCEHAWIEIRRKTKAETLADNQSNIAHLENKPSRAGDRRGYEFENKAIRANADKLDIQATSVEYRCQKCGQMQEVDMLGKVQLAEAKSRRFRQIKSRRQQAKRLVDIQNKIVNPGKKPLAKLDGNLADAADSASKYQDRGFDVEILN